MDERSTKLKRPRWEARSEESLGTNSVIGSAEILDATHLGQDFILNSQRGDGVWSDDPVPDIRTTAEYIAMSAWFGTQHSPRAQACAMWLNAAA